MHNFFKSKFRIATISFTKNKKHITSELNFFAQQFEKRKFCYNSDTSLAERLLICFPSRFIKEDRLFRCDKNIAAKDSKQCAWKRFIISAAKKYPPKPLDNFIIFFHRDFVGATLPWRKKTPVSINQDIELRTQKYAEFRVQPKIARELSRTGVAEESLERVAIAKFPLNDFLLAKKTGAC